MKRRIFGERIAGHSDILSIHALQFTKDKDDAKDLLQNTMLKALDNYETYREGGNLSGWLYRIMRNTYINDYKRVHAHNLLIKHRPEISCSELLQSATMNLGEGRFVEGDIKHALRGLDSMYTVPFICYFEGYKYEEIAGLLHIPVGTVKRRIHTARFQLKKALQPYFLDHY